MYKQDLKQLVCQEIDKLEPVLSKLADYLHQHPEISMQEIKAVNYLKKLLEEFQFIFTPILKDTFSTAFIATKGNEDKKIGFLAEYDALPDIGHGCGHNLISLMSLGAGLAFNAVTDKIAAKYCKIVDEKNTFHFRTNRALWRPRGFFGICAS